MAVVTSQPPHVHRAIRSRAGPALVALLVALALVAAGFVGWAVRGDGSTASHVTSTPAAPLTDAGSRYMAIAHFVSPRCPGIGTALPGPEGQCEVALQAMSALLRDTTWPAAAAAEAKTLATAIDKQVAFLQRMDKATPAELQKILAGVMRNPSASPWQVTNRAATAMRDAIGLGSNGTSLL